MIRRHSHLSGSICAELACGTCGQLTYSSQYIKINSELFSLNPLHVRFARLAGDTEPAEWVRARREHAQYPGAEEQYEGDGPAVQAAGDHHCICGAESVLGSGQLRAGSEVANEAVTTAQQLWMTTSEQVRARHSGRNRSDPRPIAALCRERGPGDCSDQLLQQETILKNALSRAGIASTDLASVHIVPLDR